MQSALLKIVLIVYTIETMCNGKCLRLIARILVKAFEESPEHCTLRRPRSRNRQFGKEEGTFREILERNVKIEYTGASNSACLKK
jgi:hypothetical protein